MSGWVATEAYIKLPMASQYGTLAMCTRLVLRPLGRQDNEDLDRLIVAADTGLLWLTCLLFDSEWFWDSLLDSWTDYLMSPFEDYPLDDAQ